MPVRTLPFRRPEGAGDFTTGVTSAPGAYVPSRALSTERLNVIRHKVELPGNIFGVTAAVGGAADAQGQKLLRLTRGVWMVLGSKVALTFAPQAGMSVATAVYSLGTAAATDANAALTSTEADVLASQTMGDGTIASGVAESDLNTFVLGTGTAIGVVDTLSAEKDVFLNIGGTFTHASDVTGEVTVSGTVELYLVDLGL